MLWEALKGSGFIIAIFASVVGLAEFNRRARLRRQTQTTRGWIALSRGDSDHPSKFCFACGSGAPIESVFCPSCGVPQPRFEADGGIDLLPAPRSLEYAPGGRLRLLRAPSRNQLAAALFAIFLGGLGLHRFYLGRPGSGILYLLLCWTFIPALIGFIEGLFLLGMRADTFARRYP